MTNTGETATTFDDTGQEEIVVDLPYVDLVAEYLGGSARGVHVNRDKQSTALDLGVVTVQAIETLSQAIRSQGEVTDEKFPPREDPRSNLDVALIELRRKFRNKHEGWEPALGKARTVHAVHSTPHIGGEGYPMAVNVPPLPASTGYSGVKIGLIDTKIYPNEDFDGRLITSGDALLKPEAHGFNHLDIHGTFSVGQILKKAPNATVIAEAALHQDTPQPTVWDVATAMARFADRDVSVLVLPLVCFTDDGEAPLALSRAVDLLRNKIVVIAAAGNHGAEKKEYKKYRPGFPAACDGVVAVGALNDDAPTLADFNPKDATWIKLVARGRNVESTSVYGKVQYTVDPSDPPKVNPEDFCGGAKWSGTSFAATTVAGEVASRMIADGKSAFEVIDELKKLDPKVHGIGGYALL